MTGRPRWSTSQLDRLRDAAATYARCGWAVIPIHHMMAPGRHRRTRRGVHPPVCSCRNEHCPAPGAHPLCPDWKTETSRDLHVVRDWWWATRPWNIGLPTGELFDAFAAPHHIAVTALESLRESGHRSGPVTMVPSRTWWFLTEPAWTLNETLPHSDTVRHHTTGDWIPAPPSSTPNGDAVQWLHKLTRRTTHRPWLPDPRPIAEALQATALRAEVT